MLATITLQSAETFEMKRTAAGDTVLTIPLEVLKRAYCMYVAEQVGRSAARKPEGALQ